MKRYHTFFFVACLSFALFSCGKEDPDDGKGQGGGAVVEEPSPFDNADLFGTVTDAVTGEGVAGVPVSDGYSYTKTNSRGEYGLRRDVRARKVYYCTPEAYEVNLDSSTGRPTFFNDGILPETGKYRQDFKLTKLEKQETEVTIIAVGDPQCAGASAVRRFKEETIEDIKNTVAGLKQGSVYAITLGDIVYDSNDMWESCASAMSSIVIDGRRMPFFQCIGNHDHDSTVPEAEGETAATLRFIKMFGPVNYSFDRAGVHVVVMDNISVKSLADSKNSNGKKWGEYSVKFDDEQENWLSADLGMVKDPGNKTLVLCMHAPMSEISASRSERILEMMTAFKEAHIFSGHTHCNENHIFNDHVCRGGSPVYDHTHATACGMWWKSNSDISGCPAGYSVYSFSGGNLRDWYLKGTHSAADFQVRAYDGNEVYPASFSSNGSFNWLASLQPLTSSYNVLGDSSVKGCLIADVFNSDDRNWTVELFVDGIKTGDFKLVPDGNLTNVCHAAWAYNDSSRKNVNVRKALTNRLWYFKPSSSPSELKNWEIVATQTIPGSGVKHTYKCSSLTGGTSYGY